MRAPDQPSQPAFDWLDVLLGFATICGGFFAARKLGISDDGRVFKYVMAGLLVAVIVARRVLIGPPRVVAVRGGTSALGLLSTLLMLFGLVIASFGGYLLYAEDAAAPPAPAVIDRDAIEKDLGLAPLLGKKCTREGKALSGRACMTDEERAAEAAADEKARAEELVRWEAAKKERMARLWTIAGVGAAVMLAGIGLDLLRSRRHAVRTRRDPPTS